MLVQVEDGELRSVQGDGLNLATRGKICSKGLSYVSRHNAPDRLLYPLRRVGERGSSQFERISWQEALETIAYELTRIKAEHGPEALLYYSYAGAFGVHGNYLQGFWSQLGGVTDTYGDLCYPTGSEATRLTYGTLKHNAPWDLVNAGLIVLWGKNPARTNVQQMHAINQALDRGAKLVTIDPIRNESSVRSSLHLSPNPGSDAALALCVANELIKRGAHDVEFLEQHALGFPEFQERAAEYPLERAAELCGLSIDDIEQLVELFLDQQPVSVICGYGMQSYTNSGQAVRAVALLPALVGSVGKSGGGFHFANKQAPPLKWPYAYPAPAFTRSISITKLGREIAESDNPPIKLAWVERGNPLVTNPDVKRIEAVFEELDMVVVVEQFLTDTARFADIVLPSTSMFEYSTLVAGYWHPYLMLQQQVIPPRGECRNETWIYRELGKLLGLDLQYLPEYDESVLDEVLQSSGLDVTLDELRAGPWLSGQVQEVAYSDHKFPTPSGKIELVCESMQLKWGADPLPCYVPLQEGIGSAGSEGKRYPLQLLTPHSGYRIHSQFNNLPWLRHLNGEPVVEINAQDAKQRQIKTGDWVLVFNGRSELKLKACVTEGIKPGCVAVDHGWWQSDGARANELTADRHTDIGHGAAFNDVSVEVVRYRGGKQSAH